MNKGKAYTQLILQRLTRKADDLLLKSTHSSNQTTQATPNDSSKRTSLTQVRHFFDNFEKNVTYIHETVTLSNPPPTKRCLYWDLSQIQVRQHRREVPRERVTTQPVTSEFSVETRRGLRVTSRELRDNKSSIVGRRGEERISTICKTQQQPQPLPRYRSLKTLPTTNLPTHTSSRRTLFYPLPAPKPSPPLASEWRGQPRRCLKKCESFEKYLQGRAP